MILLLLVKLIGLRNDMSEDINSLLNSPDTILYALGGATAIAVVIGTIIRKRISRDYFDVIGTKVERFTPLASRKPFDKQ